VDIYDIKGQSWSMGTARPLAAANITAVPLEDSILVPGGCDQQTPFVTVHRYDASEDTWETVAPLPQPLCAYAMATLNGNAYLFGGWGPPGSNAKAIPRRTKTQAGNYQTLTYRYDPEADAWEERAAPLIARAFGAAAALGDRLYYIGGYDGKDELATCEVYDPEEDKWDTCPRLLLPRGGLKLTTQGWRLYAVGGGWDNYLGFNEYYNPKADAPEGKWSLIETPLVGEWRNMGLVSTETTLYALGGWHGDYMNRTYALETYSFRIFLPTIP
jgi:N-acetylneuraminic acid mutarotase